MAVQIRMARHGSKKSPFYRIVVTDGRSPRDGRFIEQLGIFNPLVEANGLQLNEARFSHWAERGAKPSQTLAQLIKRAAKPQA